MALASPGDSSAITSTGGWVSTIPSTPVGNTTPSFLTQIDTTDHVDSSQVAALNAAGHGVIAWRDVVTGYVMASEIQPGQVWSAPQAVARGAHPAVAIDAAGDITVVWVDPSGDVEYGYRAANSGAFVTGQIASHHGSGAPGNDPRVAMDAGGNAWVVWTRWPGDDGDTVAVFGAYLPASALAAGAGPTWNAELASASGPSRSVSLATNPNGSGIVAAFTTPGNTAIRTVYAQAGSGSFGTSHAVPNPGPGSMNHPVIALSNSGVAVLGWDECGHDADASCDPSANTHIEIAGATTAQLGSSTGSVFTSPQSVALGTPTAQQGPTLAVNNNELALAWNDLAQPAHPLARVDGATEPLADLTTGVSGWQQLDPSVLDGGQSSGGDSVAGISPQITIDAGSNVTLAWEGPGSGDGLDTVDAARASACGTACASVSRQQLDSQADDGGFLSLASDPGGDALLSWTSYSPSGGAIPTVVAGEYDPGPALSNASIPSTGTTGTPSSFSIQATDTWSGLDGPITIHWDFGDGTTASGGSVSHTYTNPGTYTVTVTASTRAASSTLTHSASSTLTGQINVSSPEAIPPAAATAPLSDAASWGSRAQARSVSADLTVPALSCAGSTAHLTGQALGVRLWGSHAHASKGIALADFAGVRVECKGDSATYRPSFTLADVGTDTTTTRNARLHVTAGDLVALSVTAGAKHTSLTITDLSTPHQAPATVTGPSLDGLAGWQVGAFPISGVDGPFPTLPTAFTETKAGGKGIASLRNLVRSGWRIAHVSRVGRAKDGLSVLYRSVPKAPAGGSLAAAAHGMIRYQRPGQHGFAQLHGDTALPKGTLIDAGNGTVQLSNSEPHGQNQSFTAWGGNFTVGTNSKGATTINVSGTWSGSQASAASASNKNKHPKGGGSLWTKAHGNFTTKGNDGAAAVLGTKWLTRNLKQGTLFKVAKDRYDANDRIRVTVYYPHRHTVVLQQGQSVLAPARAPKVSPFAFTLVGVKESNGAFNTPAPGYYQLVLLSYTRPFYVDAAVSPNQPAGGGSWFFADGRVNGEPRWQVHFQLKSSLSVFQLWNIGIKIGSKLYVVPLRLK